MFKFHRADWPGSISLAISRLITELESGTPVNLMVQSVSAVLSPTFLTTIVALVQGSPSHCSTEPGPNVTSASNRLIPVGLTLWVSSPQLDEPTAATNAATSSAGVLTR